MGHAWDADRQPPILIPSNHPVIDLLIIDTPRKLFHAGVRRTLAETRERLWVTRGRPFSEPAASLPAARVQAAMSCEVTSVDFAGPLTVKPFSDETTEMELAYICIFTCATSRSVHLELVRDLSANKINLK